MTLQNLKYVIEVANQKSFSAAAKSLYISQSTLSSSVKELENNLGISLFLRSSRGVKLTTTGEDFLKYAKDIVSQSDYLENRYQTRNPIPMSFSISTQRLSFSTLAYSSFITTLNMSEYDVAIRECDTCSVIHDVANNRSELGILSISDEHFSFMHRTLNSYNLTFTEISTMTNYVFIRSQHPLANNDSLSLSDLEDYPFVTYDQEAESSHFTEEIIFYTSVPKNVHVSDRCTKIALIRSTNCFSIGSCLTNSNGDAFHKNMNVIKAIKLNDKSSILHIGYICKRGIRLQKLATSYLSYLSYLEAEIKSSNSTLKSISE